MAKESPSPAEIAIVEFRDDGRYEATCPRGHLNVILLQEQKFELLFEIGAYAIRDGYYREAVTSFASSLERFYEFFIKAVLFEKGVEKRVIEASFKNLSKYSERQLGGFIVLYTSEFQSHPILLGHKTVNSQNAVKFRNEVIHRGKIPSSAEALEFGQTVLDLIRPTLQETRQRYPKGAQKTIVEHLQASNPDPKERTSTMTMPTIVSLSRIDEDWNKRSLEQAIKELRRWE